MSGDWSFIPKVYITSLIHSKRIPILEKNLAKMGVNDYEINLQVLPKVRTSRSFSESVTDNHQQVYRKALSKGYPFICVFEDDVFSKDPQINEHLQEIKHFLNSDIDWDLLYIGHFPFSMGEPLLLYPKIRPCVSWCAHGYLISSRAMKFMCQFTPSDIYRLGQLSVPLLCSWVFPEVGNLDTVIAHYASRGKLKSYAYSKMFVLQSSLRFFEPLGKFAQFMTIRGGGNTFGPLLLILWVVVWLVMGKVIKTNSLKSY